MSQSASPKISQTACVDCPIRRAPAFRPFTEDELEFVSTFKRGEFHADRGTTILQEGGFSAHLYTLLSGWAFRYKLLPDGRRQILNYLMPGDLIGLQASLIGELQHSVDALTPTVLCVFERNGLMRLFRQQPELGYDVTWLASREEQMLDENLLSVGRRSALERAAYLIGFLSERQKQTNSGRQANAPLPLRQQHVADTLGLSLVHTNRTLKRLAARGAINWGEHGCEVLDQAALADIAHWEGLPQVRRPFI